MLARSLGVLQAEVILDLSQVFSQATTTYNDTNDYLLYTKRLKYRLWND